MKWAEELGYTNGVKPLAHQELRLTEDADVYRLTFGNRCIPIRRSRNEQVRLERLRYAERFLLKDVLNER